MVLDTDKVNAKFKDDNGNEIVVNVQIKDLILFRLLERIGNSIQGVRV